MHERTDAGRPETRPGVRTLRSVEIRSDRHGLHGVADVVELRGGRPYPVEYKRGKPKTHRADEVQLCAQALCLEEMFACDIPEGALFYGKTRHRSIVPINRNLREITLQTADAIRQCRDAGTLPTAINDRSRCTRCSLLDQCQPGIGGRCLRVAEWLDRALARKGAPE